jgi:hypothetical protein
LVTLRYVDEATLSEGLRWVVRLPFPAAAILIALGFFLSTLSPQTTQPNALIYLARTERRLSKLIDRSRIGCVLASNTSV